MFAKAIVHKENVTLHFLKRECGFVITDWIIQAEKQKLHSMKNAFAILWEITEILML